MTNTIPRERAATAAELADEAARAERARTGRQHRRTLHALCEQAARMVECRYCGARPGTQCTRRGGYHLARFVRAFIQGRMAADEFAVVLGGLDVFTEATVIRDGQR